MFGLFKRKKELPDFSPAMLDGIRTTVAMCSRQIEQFFGVGTKRLPFITPWHDTLVGTYTWGFLLGSFLASEADLTWANGDRALADLGFGTCVACALTHLLTPEGRTSTDDDDRLSDYVVKAMTGVLTPKEIATLGDRRGERLLACLRTLFELHSRKQPESELVKIDVAGGADGMAAMSGEPLPEGGFLLHLLQRNVTPEEKLKALPAF